MLNGFTGFDIQGDLLHILRMNTETSVHQALAAALRERLAVIADREHYQRDSVGHLERLVAASNAIADLQKQLPPGSDPQLAHYLQRCSYDKALAFLEEKSLR